MRRVASRFLTIPVVAALALPAGAQAATVTTDRACYRAGEEGTVTVGGFRSGSTVDATVEGQPMVNLLPDGPGVASAPFTPLASPSRGDVAETIVATDANSSPVLTAQATYRVTATHVTMSPARAKPSATVTWKLAGFGLGTAYLHVARRNAAGRTVTLRTLRLGALKAPCGSLSVRTKQLPISRSAAGTTYVLRFSTTSSPTAPAFITRQLTTASRRGSRAPSCRNCGVS